MNIRVVTLAISALLFSTFFVSVLNASLFQANVISSSGTISYESPGYELRGCILIDPQWYYYNFGEWVKEYHFDMMKQYGVSIVNIFMNKWAWDNNPTLPNLGVTHKQRMVQIVGWCKERGLKVIIQAQAWGQSREDTTQIQENQPLIGKIVTDPLTQNEWISTWKDVVATLHPDRIQILNEPEPVDATGLSMTWEEYFTAYRNFCITMIDELRSADPNVTIHVQSAPYWQPWRFARDPINQPNVIYDIHIYTCIRSEGGDFLAPEIQAELANGNIAQAKALFEQWMLGEPGISKEGRRLQEFFDKGLTLFIGETGINTRTYLEDPNHWKDRMDLVYDFCEKYKIGFTQIAWNWNVLDEANKVRYGMLNEDGTALNEIGKYWLDHLP